MTATDETIDRTPVDGAAVGAKAQPGPAGTGLDLDVDTDLDTDVDTDVAEAAARDVARLLDRRGLREVVALAHRVLLESTRLATTGGTRSDDTDGNGCTLRQHERSTRRGAAGRAVDDDRA
jgi:hypothetical protein